MFALFEDIFWLMNKVCGYTVEAKLKDRLDVTTKIEGICFIS